MKFKLTVIEKTLVAQISGEIDHYTAVELKDAVVEKYISEGCIDIIFDFTDLCFMDSAGVGMLIGRYKQAYVNGGYVYAMGIKPVIERIFTLSGLNKIIKRCDSVNDVLCQHADKKEVI